MVSEQLAGTEERSVKMTNQSFNLDITNLTFSDTRPKLQRRRHNRKSGWRPPPLVNVNIPQESYDIIRSLAVARGQRHSPFYDEVLEFVREYRQIKEDLEETREFLQLSIQDKNELKNKIKQLESKLVISNNNDQRVILDGVER